MSLSPLLLFLQEAAPSSVKSVARGRLSLWGEYSLADPLFLALIPMILLGVLYGRSRWGREPGRVPMVPGSTPPPSLAQRLHWLPASLQVAALLLVVFALTRPLRGDVLATSVSEGVDIALVLDRSSSMQHEDLETGKTRLDVVKEVVADFAERRMTDRETAADNIALIQFARYPQLLCPFTLDVEAIRGFLGNVELVLNQAEDGTGIGIALAKSVAVLRETDAESKVIVLLTDGQNTLDEIAPLEAARLAAEEGIRVYTVFAGRYLYRPSPFGVMRPTEARLDTSELEKIAEMCGGKFFRARDREGLESAYSAIEELERTPREERRFSESFDLYPILLGPALAIYLLAWALGSTWLRRLP